MKRYKLSEDSETLIVIGESFVATSGATCQASYWHEWGVDAVVKAYGLIEVEVSDPEPVFDVDAFTKQYIEAVFPLEAQEQATRYATKLNSMIVGGVPYPEGLDEDKAKAELKKIGMADDWIIACKMSGESLKQAIENGETVELPYEAHYPPVPTVP